LQALAQSTASWNQLDEVIESCGKRAVLTTLRVDPT
jgi:hypothetical protein